MAAKVFYIDPVSKPRMTKSDAWKGRPCVEKYWEFKDEIREQQGDFVFPDQGAVVRFYISMPKSWSKKKKEEMEGRPHQVKKKKDLDNLLKALWDALDHPDEDWDDSYIWSIRGASKVWSKEPKIIISQR